MNWGAIIMDGVIAAIIGVAGVGVAAVLTEAMIGKRVMRRIDALPIAERKQEHEKLSADHAALLTNNALLLQVCGEMKTDTRRIVDIANDEKAKQEMRYGNLTDAQRTIIDSLNRVQALGAELQRLQSENVTLRQQMLEQQDLIHSLRGQMATREMQQDFEVER